MGFQYSDWSCYGSSETDLAVVDKKRRAYKIIDFAVPGDRRIEEKEKEKIEKYQDLKRESQKNRNVRKKIIPLVVGSLGAIPKQFGNRLKETGITAEIWEVQKTVLLGTARILRKVLEILLLLLLLIIIIIIIIIVTITIIIVTKVMIEIMFCTRKLFKTSFL